MASDLRWKWHNVKSNAGPKPINCICSLKGQTNSELFRLKEILLISVTERLVVLVARIGPGAERVLAERSIKALTIPDFIDEALKQIQQMNLFL